MTNPSRDIRDADCIFIIGSNTAEAHPVISYEVVRAVKKGANLIVVDPRRIPMVEHATLWLRPSPGSDMFLLLALAHVMVRESWADEAFVKERTEGFDEFRATLGRFTPAAAELATGIPAEQIEKAARWYALGERATGASAYGDGRGHSTILYAMGITQHVYGTDLVRALANLSMMSAQVGRPSTGVNPLRGQSNVQGACDNGGLPDVLPGYQKVTDEAKRKAVANIWGLEDLPGEPGLSVVETMEAVLQGHVRALYVMGENPMLSDPNLTHVERALKNLDLLVVQDIFMSETAQLAHVILPAAAALEKDGTFTNTERRIQLLSPVVSPPGEARPDWQIICEVGRRLDARLGLNRPEGYWRFPGTAAIMAELAQVNPLYRGVSHARLGDQGIQWPVPSEDHPGTPILHVGKFSRGLGKFHVLEARLPVEPPDAEYPLILSTGRVLYHYHTGTMTRRSGALSWRESRGYVEVNREDALAAGIRDGGIAILTSRRGQVRVQARVGSRVPKGVVFLSFHWKESPANMLTLDHPVDPVAGIPELKVCAVRLEAPKGKGNAS